MNKKNNKNITEFNMFTIDLINNNHNLKNKSIK